ncbi:MAG: MOSC N-terminal beta barrel domain-containing protein [Bryobacteraceae bacterium]
MFVKEIWRYPVKSMAGERVSQIEAGPLGLAGDRIVVVHRRGRVVTSRTHPKLLGLKGTIGPDGAPRISGNPWNSPEALALVREAAGADAELTAYEGADRFDILPLLVATDGAIAHMGFDSRRLRPNLIIGGVEGLEERKWPGRRLRIGDVVIEPAQLRGRCVMTTYDPDTLKQDPTVLRRIVRELGGTMALDTSVITGGLIEEGTEVFLEAAKTESSSTTGFAAKARTSY